MMKRSDGASFLLGIVSAIAVFIAVQAAFPGPTYSSSFPPLVPPYQKYAVVTGSSFNITSMSDTYSEKVYVRATHEWNESEFVILRIASEIAYDGSTGRLSIPPAPYNVSVEPSLVLLRPDATVIFNVTFTPWPSADDMYAFTDVTFIWGVGCQSYPVSNPSSGVALGGGYIVGVKGPGFEPIP